jgi:hypothetical protein
VFGDLKFVAVHDLGELGPKESAGVVAYWGLVNNLSGLAVWAVLIAAFVLLRENHTPKALLILVPVIAVYVLWTGIKFILSHCTGMPSAAAVILDTLVAGFTVGMASVLLVAGRFQKTNRFVIVIAAFMVMALAFGVAVAGSMQFDEEMVQLGMFFGVMISRSHGTGRRRCLLPPAFRGDQVCDLAWGLGCVALHGYVSGSGQCHSARSDCPR